MPQSLALIYIHIIFSTKNREPFLTDGQIRKEMHAYSASVSNAKGSKAITVGGVADHVHILCNLSRTIALSELIKEIKRNSSKWVKTKGGACSNFQWQNGYGAFSVSHSNVQRVRNYIENQEEHHKKISFKDEFRNFMKKHGVEFDEQYVWD
ncbi:MAG: IS200/IS605 family transposase [Desulfobacteraceae bacterium]|nr:IS200/IS605 family transposase [Desulfobacteraceae bacterium]